MNKLYNGDKLVEWEVTMECNFGCTYCTNLDKSIKPIRDKALLKSFIESLGKQHPGTEVFIFGGEPFLHPDIAYIIECFNEFNIPFVIQTNFSKKSVKVMKSIKSPFKIQISIHPTEVKLTQLSSLFKIPADIRTVDVMYTGKAALEYYLRVKDLLLNSGADVFLTPITDFGDGVSNLALLEFNRLKKDPNYKKFIRFEEVERLGRDRSDLWIDKDFSPKGKPCIYNDKYFLYRSDLEMNNCCYRVKHDGICQFDKCFLM
jgi:MoaA/NifB/PqqE/SkfB family radical SAM enzyme